MSDQSPSLSATLTPFFKYPFKDPRWVQKSLVFLLLCLASFIIPLLPGFLLLGYSYRISRRIIKEDGVAVLPEWDEWGELLRLGFRYWAITFVYSIPMMLVMLAGYAMLLVPYFSILGPLFSDYTPDPNSLSSFGPMLFMFLSYPLLGASMLLGLFTAVFTPPALMHAVAEDSFGAAFHFSSWWKIFRKNLGGFLIALLLVFAVFMIAYTASYILMMTIVLMCLYPIIGLLTGIYGMYIASAVFARSYRDGLEQLAGEGSPSKPVPGTEASPQLPRRTRNSRA